MGELATFNVQPQPVRFAFSFLFLQLSPLITVVTMADQLQELAKYVDFDKKFLYISAASIAFNPTFWNIVARQGPSFHRLHALLPDIAKNTTTKSSPSSS